jgi:ABC-type glycerol-3-phosphate transport system substrate-binding protein
LSRISRRRILAAIGAGGAWLLAVACGGAAPAAAPTPSKPAAAPSKAAEPAAAPRPAQGAPGTRPAEKPAEAAAKPTVAPTPTNVPTATPVPYTSGDKVLLRVHWEGIYFNEFAKLINEYNSTQGPKDKIYLVLERQLQPQTGTGAGAVIAIFFYFKALGDANVVGEQYAIRPFGSNGSKKITNTRNFHYEVSSRSKMKDQAWKFLKWMNEGPEFRMATFQVDVFGFLPAVKAVDLPKWWPEQLRETWREALNETVPIPNIRGMPRVIDITAQYQNEVILGKSSIQDAMNKADAEVKKALEEAYR